jgi:hypothetical protein
MSFKPILFSTPMVQEITARRKTMTRRVINPQPPQGWFLMDDAACIKENGYQWTEREDDDDMMGWFPSYDTGMHPKYQPGDILWVRETWAESECEYCRAGISSLGGHCTCDYVYRANYGTTEDDSFPPSMFKWRPSIFMPKEACRLFLSVTDVRAERLQEITEADAIAEGCGPRLHSATSITARQDFMHIWQRLNDRRDGGKYAWITNPWVWVYTFERIDKPEGWPEATE